MLVLTRKPGESIVIEGGIEVVLVECNMGRVRLGIKAPQNIKIWRKELLTEGMKDGNAPKSDS